MRWFHTKPERSHLVIVRNMILEAERDLHQLSEIDARGLSTEEYVDADIKARTLMRSVNTLSKIYYQLLDCHMMSDEQFRIWQHDNKLTVIRQVRYKTDGDEDIHGGT